MNNEFDIKRFCHMLKWQLASNSGKYKSGIVGAFLVFIFVDVICVLGIPPARVTEEIAGTYNLLIIVFAFIGVCLIFSSFKTNQKRMMLLTYPSSNMEKFLSLYVCASVIWVAGLIISCILADTLRVLITPLVMHVDQFSAIPYLFDMKILLYGSINEKYILNTLAIMSTTVWIHSIFMLGGNLFRRHALLKSVSVIFAIGIAVSLGAANTFGNMYKVLVIMETKTAIVISYFISLAFIFFNYIVSYKLFKRMQVINNKWINV